jgi:hypothetical protein
MSKLAKSLLAGAALAAGAALFLKRDKVAGLLPGRSSEPAAPPPPRPQDTPPVSNYDASGPVENTATRVPVPPAYEPPVIDEAAEEAAAAAEAANIGGPVSDYAGSEFGETATEAERPLMEAGEGEAEGQEQAEAELAAAAEPTAPGESPEQHQIEDVLESQPTEQIEPLVSETPEQPDEAAQRETSAEGSASEQGGSEWRTWSGRSINP